MINGLIKANDEGFEDTTKNDRPKKFERQTVAFDAMNFKNPVPTAFKAQQIKENNVYGPKDFNAKLNYTEDPFKVLFGYTKRINPDDHLNPKYYEYGLGNKNENSFIIENLQAENGTATNDVEQREALKDFLESRKLQEEEDNHYEKEIEPWVEFGKKKMIKRAFKQLRTEAGLPEFVTERSRRGRGGRGRGAVVVEPVQPPDADIPPAPVDKFKEFENKTDIGDFEFIDGKTPSGDDIPSQAHMRTLINNAVEYLEKRSKDRSAIIKLNKYLNKAGIEPLTSKELREVDLERKLKALVLKMYGSETGSPPSSKSFSSHKPSIRSPPPKSPFDADSSPPTRSPFASGSSPTTRTPFGSSPPTRTAAGGGAVARDSPRSMIKGFVRSSEDEQARKDFLDRLEKTRSEIEEEIRRGEETRKAAQARKKETDKPLSAALLKKKMKIELAKKVKARFDKWKDVTEDAKVKRLGAELMTDRIGDQMTKKVKSRFDQWKDATDKGKRKAEMDEKFAAEEEVNAQKFEGARKAVDIKAKANTKSLKEAFEKLKNHSPSKYDKPVDVESAVNPVDAPKGDTKRIRESLGEPGTPENKKVLRDVVSILGPILHSAKIAGNRKIPPYYVPYMNALYKANEDLQKHNGKSWRSTSTLARLEEALDYVERILDGRPEPEKRAVGRPPAKAAAAVAPVAGWEL